MSCKTMHLRSIPHPDFSRKAERYNISSNSENRDDHVVARRYHRLRSLKIQTNVRDGESNFTSVADVCGRRMQTLTIPVSCSLTNNSTVPGDRVIPSGSSPKGKLATAPVLPRITLHRSLFPVTPGLGRAMQYGRSLPTAGVIAVKCWGLNKWRVHIVGAPHHS
jgi:hypothetical protein